MYDPRTPSPSGPNGALTGYSTEQERGHSKWIHLGSILAPVTGPIVGYFVGGKSNFTRAHALDALMDLLRWKLMLFCVRIFLLVTGILKLVQALDQGAEFNLSELIQRFLLGFLLLSLFEVFNLLQSISASKKASMGVWPKRNFLHGLLRVDIPQESSR